MTRRSTPHASRDRKGAVLHNTGGAGVPPAMRPRAAASTTLNPPPQPHGHPPTRFSPATLEVASIFGLDLDGLHVAHGSFARTVHDRAAAIADRLAPGSIALLTGPSGSGKSTLLRAVAEQLMRRGAIVIDGNAIELDESEYVIDVIDSPGDAAQRCALLARVGLAEARLLVSTVRRLSEGQRARLRLAMVFDAARAAPAPLNRGDGDDPSIVIVIDEFLASLDRITACCVARSVSRLVRTSNCSLLAATAHDDLEEALQPSVLERLELA